ncbi:Metallo-dependent phosphatase-like protein, partial [Lasiosphaeria miniovina]
MALQRALVLGLALLCHGVIASAPGFAAAETKALDQHTQGSAPRRLHGRFLHITDLHPDEFYRVHSSTDETDACHRGHGPAGTYGAETSDCDTPFSLVNATFDWIAANLKDEIDFVVWTGDSARHDSDEDLPRNQGQVLGTNRWIADKFAELFAAPSGHGLAIPVVPTFGNNDILPHNILLPGPNKWLQTYAQIWRKFIPEEQRHSFEFGGWFYTEVVPDRLAVFSLNTLYFFDRNAGVDDCASPSEPGYKQLEWLRVQLQFMRQRGMKAILMGHVPPARTESKQLWGEVCWQKYTLWLRQYRDVIVAGLYGHMNIDHFLLQDTHDIDFGLLSGAADGVVSTRESMEDELSAQSTADYLQELRDGWAKLDPPAAGSSGRVKEDKKGRKGKKSKDIWGERYQLSLVSPSIVPNYFPTLRVLEYNITGLEDAPVWADPFQTFEAPATQEDTQKHLDLRNTFEYDVEVGSASKKKKGKKHRGKKPKNPKFVLPEAPSKSSPPGPAYSQQPLSLTGYTQYFANLTHINNLTLDVSAVWDGDESDSDAPSSWLDGIAWLLKWRKGKHGGKKPKAPKPDPREFQFEVEYSTFHDKIYKLGDLTVNSFVDLAYRIGENDKSGGKSALADAEGRDFDDDEVESADAEDDDEEEEEDESEFDDDDDEFEADKKKKGNKDKKKKKKKKKK